MWGVILLTIFLTAVAVPILVLIVSEASAWMKRRRGKCQEWCFYCKKKNAILGIYDFDCR